MDSFGLKEEQNELVKSVSELKHIKEVMDKRVKELHSEELYYLGEIPKIKEEYQQNRLKIDQLNCQLSELSVIVNKHKSDIEKYKDVIANENKSFLELKSTQDKIIKDTFDINEKIKQRHSDLKEKELSISNRERLCDSREIQNNKKQSDLDNREVELIGKDKKISSSYAELNVSIENHNMDKSHHDNNVLSLHELRKFHEEDKQKLNNKLAQADRLIKENTDLKASLLLQADKLSKEVRIAEEKQKSLDRALADLSNQENVLKIKDLKIRKMAHDAGLQKELKELEESTK